MILERGFKKIGKHALAVTRTGDLRRDLVVDLSKHPDFHDAYERTGRFPGDVSIPKRIHSALGYLTPSEFEANWLTQQLELVYTFAYAVTYPSC